MKKIYTVYDVVAKELGECFTAKNDALARRMYEDAVEKGQIKESDYKLTCLCSLMNDFDESGKVGVVTDNSDYPYFVEHSALENILVDGE